MVDEFQDFSLMFYSLISSALACAPDAEVMAVGDDWQAINEFAGSTTSYFERFADYFEGAKRLELLSNRRSSSMIVDLGNEVMRGRGLRARAAGNDIDIDSIRSFDLDEFKPGIAESKEFSYDRESSAIARLINEHRSAGRDVAVLFRSKSHRTYKQERRIRDLLGIETPTDGSRNELIFSTAHSFKGKEAQAVIIADATARKYPLIHPTWMLYSVFGDTVSSLTEAERRLFYVAVSRPISHLDVITSDRSPSEFWESARRREHVPSGNWEEVAEPVYHGRPRAVEVLVRNGNAPSDEEFTRSKDFLKNRGFRWQSDGGFWWNANFSEEQSEAFVIEMKSRFPYVEYKINLGGISES